jgi:hypothetical protein
MVGRMVIRGMLFGEREFNFEGKSKYIVIIVYVYNKTDNIFS